MFRLPTNRIAVAALILFVGLFGGVMVLRGLGLPVFIGCIIILACVLAWKWRST